MQIWNEQNADEEVLAMVVRTGAGTTVGYMLQQVLQPDIGFGHRDPFVKVDQPCMQVHLGQHLLVQYSRRHYNPVAAW